MKFLQLALLLCLMLPAADSFGVIRITEFLTENDGGVRDVDGQTPDWIELHNDGASPASLAGWHLTDSPTNLARWTFPATSLGPGAFLVVFASGKDRAVAGAELHTNFRLESSGGYLALVQPDGVTVAQAINYAAQRANVSSGLGRIATVLLTTGGVARVHVPSDGALGLTWTAPNFSDAGWFASNSPVGFSVAAIASTLLSVDFNDRANDPATNTQSGFQSFLINSNGGSGAIQTAPTIRSFGGISLTLSNTPPFGYDDRRRTTPVDSGAFTEGFLLRDFIFAQDNGTGATGGLDVAISGLAPNRGHRLTVWSFDSGSVGSRVSDWYANGAPVMNNYTFDGGNLPIANSQYRFSIDTASDGAGSILLSGRRDAVNTSFGVFLNALQIAELTPAAAGSGLAALMLSNNATAYLRLPFNVADPTAISALTLRIRYNDGFVTYLNGQQIAARNAPGSPAWNSTATAPHSAAVAEDIAIIPTPGLLLAGANVLAIHGLNVSATDLDFSLAPELYAQQFTASADRYFQPPTPGTNNATGFTGLVADTKFSVNRGFYETPFALSISCDTAGAAIYYTTNGSPPSPTNGYLFNIPIPIFRQSFIRAAAFKAGFVPSDIDTHTYIFLRNVLRQSNNIPNYPTTWEGSFPADYEIDPNIVNHAFYGPTLSNNLRSIPVLSIVTEHDGLWGPVRGIYNHATSTHDLDLGQDWERAASAELILPDGSNGSTAFAVNCAVRMQGNASRFNERTPKHSIRLLFKSDYGPSKLRYDWFPGPVEEFDNIVLRAVGFVDAWPSRYSDQTAYTDAATGQIWRGQRYRPETSTYLRDVFAKDSHRDMGWSASRSDWVHLYINGLYWGIYNPSERIDSSFMAEHFGGWESDWDVLVGNDNSPNDALVADGSKNDWNALMTILNAGINTEAAYQSVAQLVDIDNVIDYFLLHIYIEAEDWPHHNWYAAHRRANSTNGLPATKWQIFTWDQEVSLDRNVRRDRTGVNNVDTPAFIYSRLRNWPEFRRQFGDRVHKHLFNDGALTPSNSVARFAARAAAITNALVGESARWGDAREFTINANPGTGITFTRNEWWVPELQKLWTNFFQRLPADNVARLRIASLYPLVGAPSFSQFGGAVSNGFTLQLSHTNATGVLYFTTDGSDPRTYGTGAVGGTAQAYSAPVPINTPTLVRARVLSGANWSALVEATFYPPQDLSKLSLTEIMYNPPPVGMTNGDAFEFLELKNAGTNALNLSGLTFSEGIGFVCTNGTTLDAGAFFVLVRDSAGFASKYPGVPINGVFSGGLNNGGERLTLSHALGTAIFSVEYDDDVPWPVTPDNLGFSLVPKNPGASQAPDRGSAWRASANRGGSPGADDPAPTIPAIVINEILTHSDPAPPTDSIELFNPTANDVGIAGWFLSDDANAPGKYRIPDGTVIPAGGFATLDELDFNPTPGMNGSFSLSSHGESVYLFSGDAATNFTGYSHGFSFGAAPAGVTFGRYINSVGEESFPAQSVRTIHNTNAGPRLGEVVLSEIHYHPAPGGDEFVELANTTAAPVALFDPVRPTNTWRLGGLGFQFPINVTLPANGLLLVVATNPPDFRAKYSVPTNVLILGPFGGTLQDSGERLKIERPDVPDTNGFGYIVVDEVRYNDKAPWPPAADGSGPSLQRITISAYGDDPINWAAAGPTPGRSRAEADTDGDGLPDGWEEANGTSPFIPDAGDDLDGDGQSNLQEFLAGTRPNDPSSSLKVSSIIFDQDVVVLKFIAVSNRTYTVQTCATLTPGSWQPLATVPASPTTGTATVSHTNSEASRFYRLVTPASP